jgi:DNA-binding ferritin-like protein (Dps family)
MNMAYTNSQIAKMYNDIQAIKKYKFKANTAFTIIKNAKVLKNAIELFDEARHNLLETYAEKDKAGNAKIENGNYVISNKEEFAKEFISLQNAEQDIDFSKIKLSDISEIEIEAELMETMSEFIEE